VVLIRPATAEDVPVLRALGVRTWRATYEGVLPDGLVAGGIEEFWNAYSLGAAARSGRLLVAFKDGVPAGLAEFDRVDDVRTAIWKLYVAPEAQGRGIGVMLLERVLATVGTPEVRVEHDARNAAAAAFFAKHGFAVDAVEDTGGGARTVRRVRRVRGA
jgi:ribosomal protein S18 acetylase RimI-like enzyme